MRIYLMRHGETDWNEKKKLQGQSDIPLNEFGRELAVKTAEGLRDVDFDAVFASPLVRAWETARIVVDGRKLPVMTDERLKEICFGEGEGQDINLAKRDPNHPMHNFFCSPGCYVPLEGGETFAQARERGRSFFAERILPLEGSCENILIVAHGAFNRTVLNRIADIPDEEFWRISLPNCAVSILALEKGALSILEESRVYYGAPINGRP